MIRKLPDSLINKIAAGEVVDRPASAVKELVENSLDAGARSVQVDLRDGGSALIRVADDGCGIPPDEMTLALERHATSKIAADADLESIATLGFRGEALPAICAVSRFTMVSRPADHAQGLRLAGEGGVVQQRMIVPAEQGTTIEMRDLFFNTPARLKFLKSPATELTATLRHLNGLALAHPHVQMRVSNNGKAVLTAPAARALRDRVGALFGWETGKRLLDVERDEHGVSVRGVAAPPEITRATREDVVVIVNGRPVRDPALMQAAIEAYRPLLARERFPLVVMNLALAPRDVDVNVHPTKAWVRFRHPRLVAELVVVALREALRQGAVVPGVRSAGPPARFSPEESTPDAGPVPSEQPGLFAESAEPYSVPRFGRVLGQVQNTFIVTTSDREVFFLDQHVAHERVIFERLQAEMGRSGVASQALLFPETLELSAAGRELLQRWQEPLERLGFAFKQSGGTVVLCGVPMLLKQEEPRHLIEAAVDELGTPGGGQPYIDRALAFVACRAAVKADTPLSPEAMDGIVSELGATTSPYFCPHGRPIVSRISVGDIRRELKRTW